MRYLILAAVLLAGLTGLGLRADAALAASAPAQVLTLSAGPGQPSATFAPAAGNWSLAKDAGNTVLTVDGSTGAKADYPYAVAQAPADFRDGSVTLRFKALSGKEDQAAGILFNLGSSGDYYALRANSLEDNLILWVVKAGGRSEVKSVTVPVPATGRWHELKLVIQGRRVTGFLDGKQHLVHDLPAPVSGKVGIWSKADSHVLFSGFTVTHAQ